MKHPEDEIYVHLAPKLESHGAGQFDAELTANAEAVESGAPVEDVTSGERLAVVGWARSWVREHERREVLFDLEQCLDEVHGRDGKSTLFDRLAKTRTNLLRMWAGGDAAVRPHKRSRPSPPGLRARNQ